ncbi:ATP-binding protein [Aquiflexum sp.]|uniref:hybrid sensor histidine kinase/response regulator n=1 Tax=Aquiflexum sp. TaxID=1872584 RepID=UPI003593E888
MSKSKSKYQVGSKVVLGFFLAFFLVIGVSAVTYYSIRNLLDTVESLSEPNEKLRQLNALMADVYLLDMSKTERTSDKDSVLEETLDRVKSRLDWLKIYAQDSTEIESFEQISLNISELMVVFAGLEELRYNLTNKNFSEQALNNIERRIKRQQELSEMQFLGKIRNRDFLSEISPSRHSEDIIESKGENGPPIFKKEDMEEGLIEIVKDIEELQNLDSAAKSESTESALLVLRNFVAQMYRDEQMLQDNFVQLESRLLNKNKEVFSQIQGLISNMQRDLLVEYRNQNQSAFDLTYTVSVILALLVFLGVVGSLGFVYSILNEVKKANIYREKLEEAKKQSDRLAKAKQDFLANMSHEIRNPLHAIQGYQQALDKSGISEQQKGFVKMIGFASDTLISIVNDILDFSKLEAGKIQIEQQPFDPNKLFLSIKSFFAFKAEEKKLHFDWTIDLPKDKWFIGDQLRINQILSNLLSNAIKFTQEGGIKVDVKLDSERRLLILVEDTGMGMNIEVKDKIFQEFHQGDTSITRKFGGTGLGLSIIKKLIDLQGGNVRVESELGRGTVILVELPTQLTDICYIKSDDDDAIDYSFEGKKILVVDDDAVGLKLIKLLLESKGAYVEEYLGGMNFKINYSNNEYDLAILDIQMPEVSGLEVLKILQSNQNNFIKPVIAMTANVFADEKSALTQAGFDTLLLKPFSEKQLTNKIGKLLSLVQINSGSIIGPSKKSKDNLECQYDLTDLKRFCMGDEEMLQEVLLDIVNTTKTNLEELEGAVSDKDYAKIREITHQLSSRLCQIKVKAGSKAKDLEVAIKNGKSEGIEAQVSDLIYEITLVLDEIKSDFEITIKN